MSIEGLWDKFAQAEQLENQAESMLGGSIKELLDIISQAAGL